MVADLATLQLDHLQPAHLPPAGRPLSGHQHRRAMLGALATAGVVAAVPALTAAAADPHIAWEGELPSLREACCASAEDEHLHDAACARLWAMEKRICLTPAHSPDGIAAQVRIAVLSTDEGSTLSEWELEGLRNAVRSIEMLAGRG